MSDSVIVSAVLGGFGLMITFVYNYHSRKLSNDRMSKDLFTEFNARYNQFNDSLNKISECKSEKDFEKLENHDKLKNDLVDYFNLCAEEYFWFKKGRIDPLMWEAWSAGMNDWYKYPFIQEVWENEINEFGCKSYYIKDKNEFFLKIKK